jgi:hypothetical protein
MGAPEGNTYSSKNNRLLTDTLRRVALSGDGEKIRRVCEKVFDKAEDGDLQAAQFIFDRIEGKPAQAVNLGGADGGAVKFEFLGQWLTKAIQDRNSE